MFKGYRVPWLFLNIRKQTKNHLILIKQEAGGKLITTFKAVMKIAFHKTRINNIAV